MSNPENLSPNLAAAENNPWSELTDNPPAFAGDVENEQKPKRPFISKETRRQVFEREETDLLKSGNKLVHTSKTDDGKYRVSFPGMIDLNTGALAGSSFVKRDNLLEAAEVVREQTENLESLGHDFLLQIHTNGVNMSFCSLDKFNPAPAIEEIAIEPKSALGAIVQDDIGRNNSSETYLRTVEKEGWQDELFTFIKDFTTSDTDMAEYLEKHQISDLSNLTPKQAIGLTTNLVLALTKYDETNPRNGNTEADQSTALELLEAGRANRDNPAWKGNGVCRNFACMTKAVFEAIKQNQGRYSQLKNTYCLKKSSAQQKDYMRTLQEPGFFTTYVEGHAWNDFVQVSHDGREAAVITVDVTWGSRDLETKEVIGLDRTAERLQKPLDSIVRNLEKGEQGDEAAQEIISFYNTMLDKVNNPKHKAFYAQQVLATLMARTAEFRSAAVFQKNAVATPFLTKSVPSIGVPELGVLANFYPQDQKYLQSLAGAYLSQKMSPHHFVFANDNLQKALIVSMKQKGSFDSAYKHWPEFRKRVDELGLHTP